MSLIQNIDINEKNNTQVINNKSIGEIVTIRGTSSGSSITINGQTFTGRNLSIHGDNVIIDGKTVMSGPKISIVINGDVEAVKSSSADINITGTAGTAKSGSGNIKCGDVQGNASTGSGNIVCNNINGSAKTGSGNIKHR